MDELEQAAQRAEKLSNDLAEDRRSLSADQKHARGVELLDAVRAAADALAMRLKKPTNMDKSGPSK